MQANHNGNSSPLLEKSQLARAYHNTYTVFGRLFLEGVTPELVVYAQAIVELQAALPDNVNDESVMEELAADHYHIFGYNVFPFESIFLATDNMLGGETATAVADFYRHVGFDHEALKSQSADHIGIELMLMGHLAGAESVVWTQESPAVAAQIRTLQRHFLVTHLLRWLLPFIRAVKGEDHTFYSALCDLVMEVAGSHIRALDDVLAMEEQGFNLPEPPALLDNEDTRLKDIAGYLLTPAYGGFYLSRDMISLIAQRHELPRGFGDRVQMLTNLLRSAGDYGVLPEVLGDVQSVADSWARYYSHPDMQFAYANIWLDRINAITDVLDRVGSAADGLDEE